MVVLNKREYFSRFSEVTFPLQSFITNISGAFHNPSGKFASYSVQINTQAMTKIIF